MKIALYKILSFFGIRVWKEYKELQNYEVSNLGEVRNKHTKELVQQFIEE